MNQKAIEDLTDTVAEYGKMWGELHEMNRQYNHHEEVPDFVVEELNRLLQEHE